MGKICHESASAFHACRADDVQQVEIAYDEDGNYAPSFEEAHHVNPYSLNLCAQQRKFLGETGAQIRIVYPDCVECTHSCYEGHDCRACKVCGRPGRKA